MADGFARDGAEHLGKILDGRELALLETLMEKHAGKSPGRRIRGDQELALLLAPGGAIDNAAKQRTGRTAQPVRAVAFD